MKKIQKIDAKPKSNVERIDKHKAAVFKLDPELTKVANKYLKHHPMNEFCEPDLFTSKTPSKMSDDKPDRNADTDTIDKRRK